MKTIKSIKNILFITLLTSICNMSAVTTIKMYLLTPKNRFDEIACKWLFAVSDTENPSAPHTKTTIEYVSNELTSIKFFDQKIYNLFETLEKNYNISIHSTIVEEEREALKQISNKDTILHTNEFIDTHNVISQENNVDTLNLSLLKFLNDGLQKLETEFSHKQKESFDFLNFNYFNKNDEKTTAEESAEESLDFVDLYKPIEDPSLFCSLPKLLGTPRSKDNETMWDNPQWLNDLYGAPAKPAPQEPEIPEIPAHINRQRIATIKEFLDLPDTQLQELGFTSEEINIAKGRNIINKQQQAEQDDEKTPNIYDEPESPISMQTVNQEQIIEFCKQGDLKNLKKLLQNPDNQNLDINFHHHGQTPLYTATLGGHFTIAHYLIKKGADVNLIDRDNARSFLHHLCNQTYTKENAEVIQTLTKIALFKHANIDLKDQQGNTPLYYALINNQYLTTKLLIKNGAHIYEDCIDKPAAKQQYETYFNPKNWRTRYSQNYSTKEIDMITNTILNKQNRNENSLSDMHSFDYAQLTEELEAFSNELFLCPPCTLLLIASELLKKSKKSEYEKTATIIKKILAILLSHCFFNHRFFENTDFTELMDFALYHGLSDANNMRITTAAKHIGKEDALSTLIGEARYNTLKNLQYVRKAFIVLPTHRDYPSAIMTSAVIKSNVAKFIDTPKISKKEAPAQTRTTNNSNANWCQDSNNYKQNYTETISLIISTIKELENTAGCDVYTQDSILFSMGFEPEDIKAARKKMKSTQPNKRGFYPQSNRFAPDEKFGINLSNNDCSNNLAINNQIGELNFDNIPEEYKLKRPETPRRPIDIDNVITLDDEYMQSGFNKQNLSISDPIPNHVPNHVSSLASSFNRTFEPLKCNTTKPIKRKFKNNRKKQRAIQQNLPYLQTQSEPENNNKIRNIIHLLNDFTPMELIERGYDKDDVFEAQMKCLEEKNK